MQTAHKKFTIAFNLFQHTTENSMYFISYARKLSCSKTELSDVGLSLVVANSV